MDKDEIKGPIIVTIPPHFEAFYEGSELNIANGITREAAISALTRCYGNKPYTDVTIKYVSSTSVFIHAE